MKTSASRAARLPLTVALAAALGLTTASVAAAEPAKHQCRPAVDTHKTIELTGVYAVQFQSWTATPVAAFVLLQASSTVVALTVQDFASAPAAPTQPQPTTVGALGTWRLCEDDTLELRMHQPLFAPADAQDPSQAFSGYQRVLAVLRRGSVDAWEGPAVAERVQLVGEATCLAGGSGVPCVTDIKVGTLSLTPMDPVGGVGGVILPEGYLMPSTEVPGAYDLITAARDGGIRLRLDGFVVANLPANGDHVQYDLSRFSYGDTVSITAAAILYAGAWYVDDSPQEVP